MLRDLRRKLVEVAAREGASRVARVRLWVGALSHISEEQLRRQWPRVVDGTLAHSATLDVTISSDLDDARAQGLVLLSLDVEESGSTRAR
ncbi:MAG TPA: hydrogenase/urease maturation nickel metallochaperone HypA [Thermoplasmata archaeon]|nr:hydrogenase/urease maturation nickel metallochaperone HypA [Thermoplasmata archaeon]